MPEQVEVLRQDDVGFTIFESMCKVCPDAFDMCEKFGIKIEMGVLPTAEVKMTVNGIEVPVIQTISDYWKRFDEMVKSEAKQMVEEMLNGSGLRDVLSEIERSEFRIQDAWQRFEKAQDKRVGD